MQLLLLLMISGFASLAYAQSVTVQYHYDPLNRLTRITYSSGQEVNYTFDSAGNITQVTHTSSPDDEFTLQVNSSGASSVAITASPTAYADTTNYTRSNIPNGTDIYLTAPATAGTANFSSWSGCQSVSGTGNRTCLVSMNQNRTVTANFISSSMTERDILIALYNATDGSNWTNNSGWLGAEGTECNWYGVNCSNGRVTRLSLGINQLSGAIPPELGQLSELQRLEFDGNQLSGAIPPELGHLSQLQGLWLQGNQLSGAIPPELGHLSQLQRLELGDNQLGGTIPLELGQLSQLYSLDLNSNELSGAIPANFGQLSWLRWLFLSRNQLSGAIPSTLAQLSELEELYLSNNCLTATDPALIAFLNNLDPDWQANQRDDCPTDGTCPHDAHLVIQNQTITGTEQFNACQTITAGPAFTVTSSGQATFTAGQRITLRPGFRIQAGGRFNARIDTALAANAVATPSVSAQSQPLTEPQYASPLATTELEHLTPAATALTWSDLPPGLRERLSAHDALIRDAQYSEASQVISFATEAALVWNDDNDYSDIYLYEIDNDRLTLISSNAQGQAANASSTDPRLAAEGQTVIYTSTATDLVSGMHNAYRQLYQYELLGHATTRLTATTTGQPGNGDTTSGIIAGDWIIYPTQASNLGEEGPGLYRQHRSTGQRELIGRDQWGQADPQASYPTATADGELIAYQRPDEQHRQHIDLTDLLSVQRLSLNYDALLGWLDHCCAVLSQDGQFIAYREHGTQGTAWLHLLDLNTERFTRLPWPEGLEQAPQFRQDHTQLWWINPVQGLGQPEVLHRLDNPLR